MIRPSSRIFLAGATGAGKSTVLRDYLLPTAPRALLLDQLGECWTWPGVVVTRTTQEAITRLAQDHRRVVLTARDRDTEWAALAAALLPEHPETPNLGDACGGLTVICGEAAMIAPNGNLDPAWADVWVRSRHVGLSLWAASQRPQQVDRIVTSQSDVIIACQLYGARERLYLTEEIPEAALPFASVPRYGFLQWEHIARRCTLLAPRTPPPAATWAAVATFDDRAGGGWTPT